MSIHLEKIWIEILDTQGPINRHDCNSDVVFALSDGSKWAATFFTYQNIDTLRKKNQATGECLSGAYFCATDMILIAEISEEAIKSVLREMLSQGEIETYCRRLS
jgi:hypothetical protein